MTDVTPLLDAYEREQMICPAHHLPYMRRDSKLGTFYSCGQKYDDGDWCRNRPDPMLVASIEERFIANNHQPQ